MARETLMQAMTFDKKLTGSRDRGLGLFSTKLRDFHSCQFLARTEASEASVGIIIKFVPS